MLQAERKRSAPDYEVGDDETSLRERLRRGDPAAAREFYDAYSARIHRFILHALGPGNNADAEDILQDTFMALAEALPFFRGAELAVHLRVRHRASQNCSRSFALARGVAS